MKKAIPVILILVMCLGLCSCGTVTITGDPVSYSNADNSFSIDLPTEDKKSWVINKDATGDTLDISDAKDTVNIQIQCLSKSQAQYVASDLTAYQDYAMINTLGELTANMKFKDDDIKVPDFIVNSKSQSFTLSEGSNDVKGNLIFLESEKCYYTYLIMAIDKAYDGNKNILLESVLSLKELTDATPASEKGSE